MLVVDGSGSITSGNFVTLMGFVVRVTRAFDISPERTRMGLVQFSQLSVLEIGLGNATDDGELERQIGNIMYQDGGNTNTGPAIRLATDELFDSSLARDDVSKLMFLFTDGTPTDTAVAVSAGEEARNRGITITAVGIAITSAVAQNTLLQITGSGERVLLVENFNEEQLNDILDELTTQSCPSM